jgi:GDPmannose 4,6-dehydratase
VTFEELVRIMVDADLKALGLVPLNGSVAQMVTDRATVRIPGETGMQVG